MRGFRPAWPARRRRRRPGRAWMPGRAAIGRGCGRCPRPAVCRRAAWRSRAPRPVRPGMPRSTARRWRNGRRSPAPVKLTMRSGRAARICRSRALMAAFQSPPCLLESGSTETWGTPLLPAHLAAIRCAPGALPWSRIMSGWSCRYAFRVSMILACPGPVLVPVTATTVPSGISGTATWFAAGLGGIRGCRSARRRRRSG